MAVGVLEHGVAALQGGQRGQRPDPGQLVAEVVGGPVEAVVEGAPGPVAQRVDLVAPGVEQAARGRPAPGRERSASRPCLLAGQPAGEHAGGAASRSLRDPRELLGDVGDHQLGGVGRGRGADVGDQVEQRGVGLVADRGDHRGAGRVHRPEQAPRRRTAAGPRPSRRRGRSRSRRPPGSRSSRPSGLDHLARPRWCPASRRTRTSKRDRRPAPAGVLEHVALGGASRAR